MNIARRDPPLSGQTPVGVHASNGMAFLLVPRSRPHSPPPRPSAQRNRSLGPPMEAAVILIYATAAAASSAAIVSATYDRFHKAAATILALVAGLLPWLFFLMWHNHLPSSTILSAVSLFGSGPLFLVAFFLYGLGARTPRREIAAGASLIGMFAGGGFSVVLCDLLSRMP